MRRALIFLGMLVLAGGSLVWGGAAAPAPAKQAAAQVPEATQPRVVAAYGRLPLSFEANQGQTAPEVKFLSRGRGYTLFLTSTEAVLAIRGADQTSVLRMKLVGANAHAKPVGLNELPGRSHYFLGNDPTKWRTNVPHYAKVRYRNVYPGIDLVYYGNQGQLQYDFVLAAGADLLAIRLRFEGIDELRLDTEGNLVLDLPGRKVVQRAPLIYQESDGNKQPIPGGYLLNGKRQVSFQVAAYDVSRTLVIDPLVLSYSTYLGGSGSDEGLGIAVDANGSTYITGSTSSTDFPTENPADATLGSFDLFVTKLNPAGSALIYSTYLGGSDLDAGTGIGVDTSGNAYVTGTTESADFPTSMGAFQTVHSGGVEEAFVTKLDATGSTLVYSTYLGGSGRDRGNAIAVDANGHAYVVGETGSSDFPMMNPFQASTGGGDVFVAKLNPLGSALVYSTYLGGSSFDGGDGVAVDAAGNTYVTGLTNSSDFPTQSPFQATLGGALCPSPSGPEPCNNVFLTKLSATGNALTYSTYLGGTTDAARANAIAVDAAGNVYVTGATNSTDFPTTLGAFQTVSRGGAEAFVTKLDATGSTLVYSTYLGGSGGEFGYSLAVDVGGNVYVTGSTSSADFPTANGFQATFGGGPNDAFVAKLNPTGSGLIYSTYLGGNSVDTGFAIALDTGGNAYVTGGTRSTDFPTVDPIQSTFGGGQFGDAFIAKILGPPNINAGGVVNGASFAPGAGVAPGSITSVFGTNLASSTAFAGATPLPTTLGGATMRFDGFQAVPKFFASPLQVNIQIPWELAGQAQASLTNTVGSATSPAETVVLATLAPGLFATNQAGSGQGAILIANTGGTVAAPVGTFPNSQPAVRGTDFISIFCTGLGPVTNQPPTGAAASSTPLSTTTTVPTVTIGGVAATVSFSGLAPGFVGLYQVNVQVPTNAPVGDMVNVVLTIGGVTANTVAIAVQ